MAIDFPTSIDSLSNPETTDGLNSPSHATQHGNINDIAEALEAKVGADSSAVTSETAGQPFILRLIQDGTGSRTVTWFSTINWAGGSAPTLTTTASAWDVFGFITTAADTYDGFVIGQNLT